MGKSTEQLLEFNSGVVCSETPKGKTAVNLAVWLHAISKT